MCIYIYIYIYMCITIKHSDENNCYRSPHDPGGITCLTYTYTMMQQHNTCMCMCVYVCMYVCVYVCIYTYIYIYI